MRNAMLVAFGGSCAFGLPIATVIILSDHSLFANSGLLLEFMVAFGIWSGVSAGGVDVLNHLILRNIIKKTTGLGYGMFLDYASDCILLRKVGGGYIFVHRLLLEYFTSYGERLEAAAGSANRGGELT